jgi:hypothetical protein
MPESWWSRRLEKELSQGDVIKEIVWGTAPPGAVFLKKGTEGGQRAWQESEQFNADNDGIGHFLARGRVLPCIVLSHDCTIENDGARILVAPMFPWSNLNNDDPKYRQSALNQERRAVLPLTNVPSFETNLYADLRGITFIDRRRLDGVARVASMSVEGLERLQHQLADFFIRLDIPSEHLAASRKEEAKAKAK